MRRSDQVPGFGLSGGEGGTVQGERPDVDVGAVVQSQIGQDPAHQGGELEAVGGAEGDQDPVVAGQSAEGEVAVRGQGVEAGRAVVVGGGGRGQADAEEPGQALAGGRVGSKERVVTVTWWPPTSWAALRAASGQTGKP